MNRADSGHFVRRLVSGLICVYAPFVWLGFIIDVSYFRDSIIALQTWAILPGIIPAALLAGQDDLGVLIAATVTTLILLTMTTWVAFRKPELFVLVATGLLAWSGLSSIAVYLVFLS